MGNKLVDTSFTGRLKRIFSQDYIVRELGGGKRKVVDLKKIQQTGYYDQNNLTSPVTRVFQSGGTFHNASMVGYQQLFRTQLYQDYEIMDREAICSSALDIISSVSTLKNEEGDVLKITSSNPEIKEILENLFYDVLNIENNLSGWVRDLCKFGDFVLFLQYTEGIGIANAIPLSMYGFSREEELTNAGFDTKFYFEPGGLSMSTSGIKKEFDKYEIAHFRLDKDQSFLPFGKSIFENARVTWKAYQMMKDASLIHRITRSADKRIFYWNVGGITPDEVDPFMEKMLAKLKKEP